MYEWDDAKSKTNVEKHGITFEEASTIFSDEHCFTFEDSRYDYGELRLISIGRIQTYQTPIVVVVHTNREGKTRIISARKANRKEKRVYEQQIY